VKTPEYDPAIVPVPSEDWTRRMKKKFEALRKTKIFRNLDDRQLEQRLRSETLIGFNQLHQAALEEGHPDFLLRVSVQTARITGLASPDLAINISGGSAESLPDLSHLSDEQIAQMTAPAIDVTPKEIVPDGKPKRRKTKGPANP
jgi:hypothetical protein